MCEKTRPVPHKHAEESQQTQRIPHVHAETIKAWADGAVIEFREPPYRPEWKVTDSPRFNKEFEYRVKPEKKSPGQILVESCWGGSETSWQSLGPFTQASWNVKAHAAINSFKENGYV